MTKISVLPEIMITDDGSKTLYVKELNEYYHSTYGAIQESQFIYIEKGLKFLLSRSIQEVTIFEMGFGTGMNCYLTLLNSNDYQVKYTSIDNYPLPENIYSNLNYPQITNSLQLANEFVKIHQCDWNFENRIAGNFYLTKLKGSFLELNIDFKYDLIYYDAFGPKVQPELWTLEIFQKIKSMMKEDGVLVTYCSKGQVRRNMQAVGLIVEKLNGPPGKREILRAINTH